MSAETATVTVAYQQGSRSGSTTVHLIDDQSQHRYRIYPHWGVVPIESVAVISFPEASSKITFDGTPVPRTAQGFGLVQIFSGTHRLALAASGLFKSVSTTAWYPTIPAEVQNPFTFDLALTNAADRQMRNAIDSRFQTCAGRTTTHPSGCPIGIDSFYGDTANWTLIGEPGNPPLQIWQSGTGIDVMGHYLATATVDAGGQTAHRFSAGAYYAAFAVQGDTLTLNHLQCAGEARGLPEPKGGDHLGGARRRAERSPGMRRADLAQRHRRLPAAELQPRVDGLDDPGEPGPGSIRDLERQRVLGGQRIGDHALPAGCLRHL
ncbi:MAG: hypothetical protein ACREQM_21745, partial [Candidatus Dormibacteraceae bacterium]